MMNQTTYYCGHLIYVHDMKEIDQKAVYDGITVEKAAAFYCLKNCPCKTQKPKKSN